MFTINLEDGREAPSNASNAYSSTHSLKRLTIQQQHTGRVKNVITEKILQCFPLETILFLIKSNVRNI